MIIRICSSSGVRETIEGLGYRDEDRGLRTRVKVKLDSSFPLFTLTFSVFPTIMHVFFCFQTVAFTRKFCGWRRGYPPPGPKRVPIHTQVLGLDEFFTNGPIHTRIYFFNVEFFTNGPIHT